MLPDPLLAEQAVTIEWLSVPGKTYRLQFKNSPEDLNWTDVSGDVTANNLITSRQTQQL
jgi:hypothetical protein